MKLSNAKYYVRISKAAWENKLCTRETPYHYQEIFLQKTWKAEGYGVIHSNWGKEKNHQEYSIQQITPSELNGK